MISLSEAVIRKHARELSRRANVVGWAKGLRPRIRGGAETGEMVFRVYVSRKAEKAALAAKDIVPATLEGVPTDVVEVGDVKAVATDRKSVIRPVPLGISVSNWLVSSGSLGMLYTRDDAPGVVYAGSNAHVLCSSPFLSPSAVVERRILQPGSLYGGKLDVNVVGVYEYHTQLYPTGEDKWGPVNWFGYLIWQIIQWFRQVAGAVAERVNLLDFGVYRATKPHVSDTVDGAVGKEPFVGHLLAASDQVGVICKSKHIEALGYKPVVSSAEVEAGDVVRGASYWGDFETTVLDEGAEMLVSYDDDYSASLSDMVLIWNAKAPDGQPTIRGGWSGSSFRLIKRSLIG